MRDIKGQVLDVGCGRAGLDVHIEWKFHVKPVGVDLSVDYLKVAKTNLETYVCAVIEKLPFNDNMFDVVICDSVLEHVLDIGLAVKELYRVLKVGGKMYVQVPYKENIYKYPLFHGVRQHVRSIDEDLLHSLFNYNRIKTSRAESVCVSTLIVPLDKRGAVGRVPKNLLKLKLSLVQGIVMVSERLRGFLGEKVFFLLYDKIMLSFKLRKPVFVMIESVKKK